MSTSSSFFSQQKKKEATTIRDHHITPKPLSFVPTNENKKCAEKINIQCVVVLVRLKIDRFGVHL